MQSNIAQSILDAETDYLDAGQPLALLVSGIEASSSMPDTKLGDGN
jgi:hypothetical protein